MTHREQAIAAAKAQDLQDLQSHIAWTDVIEPRLQKQVQEWSQMLVNEALGGQLPPGKTREQIAGMAYGVQYISNLMKRILKEGELALAALQDEGIQIQQLER